MRLLSLPRYMKVQTVSAANHLHGPPEDDFVAHSDTNVHILANSQYLPNDSVVHCLCCAASEQEAASSGLHIHQAAA